MDLRSNIVSSSENQIGDAYKYASSGPNSYDCSGLVKYVFGENGISIAGSSKSMSRLGPSIDLKEAQPGDLIFFAKKGKVFHVSIITSNTSNELVVVHSTSSRGVVQQEILSSSYWQPKMYKIISLESLLN